MSEDIIVESLEDAFIMVQKLREADKKENENKYYEITATLNTVYFEIFNSKLKS